MFVVLCAWYWWILGIPGSPQLQNGVVMDRDNGPSGVLCWGPSTIITLSQLLQHF